MKLVRLPFCIQGKNEGSRFFRNVGTYSPNNTVPYPTSISRNIKRNAESKHGQYVDSGLQRQSYRTTRRTNVRRPVVGTAVTDGTRPADQNLRDTGGGTAKK